MVARRPPKGWRSRFLQQACGNGWFSCMPQDKIIIRGAREHNLKNIDVTIPRDKLVVITGLSGSGKSSLAFDTIFAEGQRRYVESLSAYARQFLDKMEKPDVDHIDGLSPAISIDQKGSTHNPRSTVGTVTEIYDYLRLLYARIGHPHCPNCGREVSQQTVQQIVDAVLNLPEGSRIMLLAPLVQGRKGEYKNIFEEMRRAGYVRVRVDGKIHDLSDEIDLDKQKKHTIEAVVDRLVIRKERARDEAGTRLPRLGSLHSIENEENHFSQPGHPAPKKVAERPALYDINAEQLKEQNIDDKLPLEREAPQEESGDLALRQRLSDSLETTLKLGSGVVLVSIIDGEEILFSEKAACVYCGISLPEIAPRTFSFNSPHGACPTCTGLGTQLEIDAELIVTHPELSLAEGAIAPWSKVVNGSQWHASILEALAQKYNFSLNTPWRSLTEDQRQKVLYGSPEPLTIRYTPQHGHTRSYTISFEGVIPNLDRRYKQTESESIREEIEGYMSARVCPDCHGARLKPEVLAVTVDGRNIVQVSGLSILAAQRFFQELEDEVSERERFIARQVLKEIRARLQFLVDVGLDYLTLDRAAASLSGGEAQRIRLATQIGSGLMGVLYVLDEPSVGLHQRDNRRLIDTLMHLRDLGNTILVVEHDEETIRSADWVVDIGPGAGAHGGEIVVSGTPDDIARHPDSITGQYLSGRKRIPIPPRRRPQNGQHVIVRGAREHNLKDIDVKIPLSMFVAVTGVSGSGKSTLVDEILFRGLTSRLHGTRGRAGAHTRIDGIEHIDKVINIDQSPIGRTPRSNPATYTKTFDLIRDLFAMTPDAKTRGYTPGRFSFNVRGGRCEACEGDGIVRIEMHFLPDVYVPCEVCKGKRYNRETLDVHYRGKSIADALEMTVAEGLQFFENVPRIRRKLQTLHDVGLGYIQLGQPATTLSGGEAQRVKLATELSRRDTGRTLYILDEPTVGLHFADVERLLSVLHRLVDAGNTVVVIEHNLDVIKTADWIIDLGPEGGELGGQIVAEGPPEEVAAMSHSYTGQFLKRVLSREPELVLTGNGRRKRPRRE